MLLLQRQHYFLLTKRTSPLSFEIKGLTLSLLHLPFEFAFCISNLNFLPKFGIFPIHIFPMKNLDSIGVVVGGGGVHGDNRGTSSFGHSSLLRSHEDIFWFGQNFWVRAKRGW